MELDITKFVKQYGDDMHNFSDSIANSGMQNIGKVTWAFATTVAESEPLTDDLDALRRYFGEFGAWEKEELAAMDKAELNALLMQCIAGDYQEYANAKEKGRKAFREWDENWGGRIYKSGRKYYYYVGM